MRLAIVGDEPLMCSRLAQLCSRSRDINVVAQVSGSSRAAQTIEEVEPDLILLDVRGPDATGFDILRCLNGSREPLVIVIGDRSEHAVEAFNHRAIDYVTKPIDDARFKAALERARRHAASFSAVRDALLARPEERRLSLLAVEKAHRFFFIEAATIDFIESDRNHVVIHVGDQKYLCRDTVKNLSGPLAPLGFMRIQRSLLLNLNRVAYAERHGPGEFVFVLYNGARLVSGRSYRRAIAVTMHSRPILQASGPG